MRASNFNESPPGNAMGGGEASAFWGYWMLAVLLGIAFSLTRLPGVFVDGGIHPLGNDGFLHAARILEIAQDPTSTHAFDEQLHWPEGLWIIWPWAYDYLAGVVVGLFSEDPQTAAGIMVFYPLLWLIVNITLIGLIARELLAPWLQLICMLAYATAPLTLSLHGVGEVDHHSAEQFWFLLGIYLTGKWLNSPGSIRVAVSLGAALAVATAFHTALFLVQVLVVASLLWSRISGHRCPENKAALAFGAALVLLQILVLLPSRQFWNFEYAFYYHSWFHLHVAALTVLAVFSICSLATRLMWLTLLAGVLLAVPAFEQVVYGKNFVTSEIYMYDVMRETQSLWSGQFAIRGINHFYSGLIWLFPLCLVYAVYQVLTRNVRGLTLVLMISAVIGLSLMTAQVRFHYFGYVFLILIPLMLIQRMLSDRLAVIVSCGLIIGAYTFSLSHYLIPPVIGDSPRYSGGLPLIAAAHDACDASPGLLLADNNWGNYLRYRTQCPLISNNHIITARDVHHLKRSQKLLSQSPENLRAIAPEVRYVFVSATDPSPLADELLSTKAFEGFELIEELRNFEGQANSRFFRVSKLSGEGS